MASRNKSEYQGMNWIRQEKRLAIYLRDGLACVYCGATNEQDRLTLDHITPYSQGGSNDASNLVTACNRCNTSRGTRDIVTFCKSVAEYLNTSDGSDIVAFIEMTIRRNIDVKAAKAIIAARRIQ